MCEDFERGYGPNDEPLRVARDGTFQYEADITSSANQIPFTPNIDLRGPWKQPGKPALDAKRPKDLVDYGIRVPEHAVIATPTWGRDGLVEYRREIAASERVLLDTSNLVEG